jgi:hypothetical protein
MAYGELLHWWANPPVIRKSVRNFVLSLLTVSGIGLGFIMLRDTLSVPYEPYGRYGGLALTLVPFCLIVLLFVFGRRRLRRQFIEAGGRLCTHCAYNLTTMNDRGTCPECGNTFDTEADQAMWASAGYVHEER